jgi:hypothetical protein
MHTRNKKNLKETLEEAAEKWHDSLKKTKVFPKNKIEAFKDGAKWQHSIPQKTAYRGYH